MTSFIELPVEFDGSALKATIYSAMGERFPGWKANPNSPTVALIDELVDQLMVPLGQLAADVAAEIFDGYGQKIVKVIPKVAVPATIKSTWKVVDDAGYTIDAGTQVNVSTSGNTNEGFRVVNPVVIPAASSETGVGEVLLEAIEPGSAANNLEGEAKPEDTLNWIEGITLVGKTSGGEDAEEPAAYLVRLAENMETLSPAPILPRDVEILSRNVPGVFRALALDLFNPETDDPEDPATWLSERTVTVALCDNEGQPVAEGVKLAVLAELNGKREGNFRFFAVDPSYTVVAVKFQVVPRVGYDQATANERAAAAIRSFLSSINFGVEEPSDPRKWNHETVVRYQDLVTLLNDQQSIDHYTELKIGAEGEPLGEADVPLVGPAPLTKPGAVEAGP